MFKVGDLVTIKREQRRQDLYLFRRFEGGGPFELLIDAGATGVVVEADGSGVFGVSLNPNPHGCADPIYLVTDELAPAPLT